MFFNADGFERVVFVALGLGLAIGGCLAVVVSTKMSVLFEVDVGCVANWCWLVTEAQLLLFSTEVARAPLSALSDKGSHWVDCFSALDLKTNERYQDDSSSFSDDS